MRNLIYICLFLFFTFLFSTTASASCTGNIYITSLSWQTGKSVHGFSTTELDYCAGLYYDPANEGSFVETYTNGTAVIGTGYTEGYSDSVPAILNFDFFSPIQNGTYTTNGNHSVIAYFQVYVPTYYDYYWYDPFSFGFADGSGSDPFYEPDLYGYWGYTSYWTANPQYVGTTSHTINYVGQTICLPGQQFTQGGQPCSSLPGCESGLQFSSTGEVCVNYVPPTEPPVGSEVTVRFDNKNLLPKGVIGSKNTLLRVCIVGLSGNKSGYRVNLEKEIINESTGHIEAYHTGTRPSGTLRRSRGITNSEGCFVTTYQPSWIAGKIRVIANVSGYNPAWNAVTVRVNNLARLKRGTNYRLNGSGSREDCDAPQCTAHYMSAPHRKAHPSNHWVVPDAIPALKKIADDYKQQFYGNGYIPPSEMVTYNDASLAWGGKFDLKVNWLNSGSHSEHRDGKNVDTKSSNIPSSRHNAFVSIAQNNNFGILHHTRKNPHYHFRWGNLKYRTTLSVLQTGIDPNMNAFDGIAITPSDLASNAAEAIFERPITQDEFELWYPQLSDAKMQGTTAFLQEVKNFYQQLFASQEYTSRFRTDEQFVEDVFASHLLREPTDTELSYWLEYLVTIGGINEPMEPDLLENPKTRGEINILSQEQRRQLLLSYFQTMPNFVNMVESVVNDAYSEPVQ